MMLQANAQDKEAPQLPDSDFTTLKKTAPPVARTAGAALGSAALTTLGAAAGPAGAAVGATVGATVGGAIMDALVGSEEKKEQYDKVGGWVGIGEGTEQAKQYGRCGGGGGGGGGGEWAESGLSRSQALG